MKPQAIPKSSQNVIILDMAKNGQEQHLDVTKLTFTIPEHLKGGVYANTLSIIATNTEITLDFSFINSTESPNGMVVSRIIIPPAFAQNIADSINKVVVGSEKAK